MRPEGRLRMIQTMGTMPCGDYTIFTFNHSIMNYSPFLLWRMSPLADDFYLDPLLFSRSGDCRNNEMGCGLYPHQAYTGSLMTFPDKPEHRSAKETNAEVAACFLPKSMAAPFTNPMAGCECPPSLVALYNPQHRDGAA